eukprot:TRINITY_DN63408_c0_g1_i1.p1 TRINITY_DN63408_c0_g1~~TRINITY_DN63408_c0_g1_i1.p1  ORF type:complete len:977 (-),score=174.32 TRINITY_DN63408_c0_g1_i1:114-3044(-)
MAPRESSDSLQDLALGAIAGFLGDLGFVSVATVVKSQCCGPAVGGVRADGDAFAARLRRLAATLGRLGSGRRRGSADGPAAPARDVAASYAFEDDDWLNGVVRKIAASGMLDSELDRRLEKVLSRYREDNAPSGLTDAADMRAFGVPTTGRGIPVASPHYPPRRPGVRALCFDTSIVDEYRDDFDPGYRLCEVTEAELASKLARGISGADTGVFDALGPPVPAADCDELLSIVGGTPAVSPMASTAGPASGFTPEPPMTTSISAGSEFGMGDRLRQQSGFGDHSLDHTWSALRPAFDHVASQSDMAPVLPPLSQQPPPAFGGPIAGEAAFGNVDDVPTFGNLRTDGPGAFAQPVDDRRRLSQTSLVSFDGPREGEGLSQVAVLQHEMSFGGHESERPRQTELNAPWNTPTTASGGFSSCFGGEPSGGGGLASGGHVASGFGGGHSGGGGLAGCLASGGSAGGGSHCSAAATSGGFGGGPAVSLPGSVVLAGHGFVAGGSRPSSGGRSNGSRGGGFEGGICATGGAHGGSGLASAGNFGSSGGLAGAVVGLANLCGGLPAPPAIAMPEATRRGKPGFAYVQPLISEPRVANFGSKEKRCVPQPKRRFRGSDDNTYPLEVDGSVFDAFQLNVVYERDRTGFEDTKEMPVRINSKIAGRYLVLEYIGSAAFSRAVQCVDLHTNRLVCMKIIKNNKDFFDQSLDEIKILKMTNLSADSVDEKHCLRLYDYFYHKEHLIIVTELLRDNLYEFSKFNRDESMRSQPYFTLGRVQRIAKQVLVALEYVHDLCLIHADLKPENILFKSYARCEVKVIDFGSSCFVGDHMSTYVQSRPYRAPEVILGLPYDQKIDIWSLGCIVAELWTGYPLFQNDSVQSLLARIISILGPFPEHMLAVGRTVPQYFCQDGRVYREAPGSTSENSMVHLYLPKTASLRQRMQTHDEDFLSFLASLLQIDPAKRPTAAEALRHPWLTPGRYADGLL